MKYACIVLALCLLTPLVRAEKKPTFESAKVLSQDMNSSPAGTYAAPIGNATVAMPLYRRSNHVVVETGTQILEWNEVGSTTIVLPVNGFIQFYRDGNWFIVLDSKNKKHKFALVGMRMKEPKE
jgi:hypothetical protein